MSAPTSSFEMDALAGKVTPVALDTFLLKDSAAANELKQITFPNLQTAILAGAITSINGDTTNAQIIAAGTGLGIVDVGDTHTLSIDGTVVTLTGVQTLTNKTLTDPTIGDFQNAQHNHEAAAGGGQLVSTLALSDTANIAYLNTDNTFLTDTRQTFTHQASKAGIALAPVAGDVTTPNDGEYWYNLTTNKFRARENGIIVDMIGGGGASSLGDLSDVSLASQGIGSILYNTDGTNWVILAAGSDTQILTLASGIPSWAAAPATGITSLGGLTAAVQTLSGTTDRITVSSVTDDHAFDIASGYVGQTSITTLGTITTGVWNGTAITGANINAASTDLTDSADLGRNTNNLSFFDTTTSLQLSGVISDETGSGSLVFGTSPTIITPVIVSFATAQHNHEDAVGGGTLLAAAISDFNTAVSANSDVTANTAKVTNATHSGDAIGDTVLTISNNVVTFAKMQDINTDSFIGRTTAASGDPENLTGTQATTLLDVFTDTLKGLVPLSGGGTQNFLRADGTFAVPQGPTVSSPFTWGVSDEDSAITLGILYTTETAIVENTISEVVLSLKNAPVGSIITVDVRKETAVNSNSFATIFSTLPTIDLTDFTSQTATTPAVISDNTWEIGRRLQLIVTTDDSSEGATGLKVTFA